MVGALPSSSHGREKGTVSAGSLKTVSARCSAELGGLMNSSTILCCPLVENSGFQTKGQETRKWQEVKTPLS